ncbi:MAG: type II toxin-antitoxin system Phd/YefM family antitoxin [bacterium]|nr:type II toxin-antitoxin system Phd/YefM family antitoxin [bacterium]
MKTVTQNEVKNNVLHLLEMVQGGEEIMIKHDHENIAVIISYDKYRKHRERPLGILKGKATYTLHNDFAITDEELLTL